MEEIIGVRIDQMEDCKRAVEHLANENGFATVIRRSTKKDPQTGIYLKIELVCTRSRQPELKGSGKRRTPSGRVGCQWKGYIAFYKRENTWKFNVQRDFHNHYRVNAERITVIRRHKRNGNVEVLNQIRALNNNRRLTAQDIAEEVGRQYSLEVTAKDVQNIRDEDQRALLGGRTPTQQFLHNLQNDSSALVVDFQTDAQNRVEYVLWTYQWSIETWKNHNEVISLDDTYKTNRFNLSLMQITGITGMNSTFNVAWALIKDERQTSYQWVLTRLQRIMDEHQIPLPMVIIGDYDTALRNALETVFPRVPTQLCLWHVMKNVVYNIGKKWEGTLEGTLLGERLGGVGTGIRREGNHLEHEDANANAHAESVATHLMEGPERAVFGGNARPRININSVQQPGPGRSFVDSADGILSAWRVCVYAETEEMFTNNWRILEREFSDQRGKQSLNGLIIEKTAK